MSRFVATANGIQVQLLGTEIAILSRLGSVLGGAGVEKDDPAARRLKPVIYTDDALASREFDRLAARERVAVRSADRERFVEGLDAAAAGTITLTAADAATWARVIGESRIVLAARKGLFDSGMSTDHADDPEVALVMYLGLLQEEIVAELLATMEDTK